MSEKTKMTLTRIAAVVFVVVVGLWIFLTAPDHIKDTNGADNYSLQSITEQNIIKQDIGSVGGPTITRNSLFGTVEFSAEKYTGVTEIIFDDFILTSDFTVSLTAFEVYEGNFQMVVVHNDEIVAVLEPDTFVDYTLENVKGYVSLRIAGESASFSFCMMQSDYDFHGHLD